MKGVEEKGITLIALIITIVVIVVLTAVSVGSLYHNGLVDKSFDAASTYGRSTDEEMLKIALTQGKVRTLESLLTPTFSFDNMPENVKEILEANKDIYKVEEQENSDEYTTYRIETKNGNAFLIKISKSSGMYEIENAE